MIRGSVILVVDDNLMNIDLMRAYLEPEGYKVISATRGQEALDILENQSIDLILLDVMMPGMNGFEVTRKIRSNKYLQYIPIILITALSEKKERV